MACEARRYTPFALVDVGAELRDLGRAGRQEIGARHSGVADKCGCNGEHSCKGIVAHVHTTNNAPVRLLGLGQRHQGTRVRFRVLSSSSLSPWWAPAPRSTIRSGGRWQRALRGGRREADDPTVGIMALVAQQEREAISRRTKEALAVARSRGVRFGNPNGAAALRRAGKGGAPLRAAIARNAGRHAHDLAPVVEDIRAGSTPASGRSPTSSTPAACSRASAGAGTSRR